MNKLNFGCGYVQPGDWVNLDIVNNGQEHIIDALKGLPFENNTFDFILANHTLQDFHYDELPVILTELKRVLKPGGTLRILTPNFKKAIDAYLNKDLAYFPISDELEATLDGKFARYLFWHGDTRCAFTFESLVSKLQQSGFSDFRSGRFGDCELDSRKEESLILECRK